MYSLCIRYAFFSQAEKSWLPGSEIMSKVELVNGRMRTEGMELQWKQDSPKFVRPRVYSCRQKYIVENRIK